MAHHEDIEPPARRRWAAPLGGVAVAEAGAANVAVAASLTRSGDPTTVDDCVAVRGDPPAAGSAALREALREAP